MLLSRPLNRRVRQLATYRPSISSSSHRAFKLQAAQHQRSRFSTASFTQSSTSSQAASTPFVSFIMHRLSILSHSLSSTPTPPQLLDVETLALPVTNVSNTRSSFHVNAFPTPSTPTSSASTGSSSTYDFSILNSVISHVLNATRTGIPSFHMRESASPSTSSGPSLPSLRGLFSEIRAKNQPTKRPPFKQPQFSLDCGRVCIPHADKKDRNPDVERVLCSSGGGEDSLFVGQNALCVADGVGGWANRPGADSAKISRLLTHYCSLKIDENRQNEIHSDPTDVVKHAIIKTQSHKIMGTATFCLVVCEGESAYTYNIGDSGYVLIRDGAVIRRSTETTWAFNAPEQIGYPPRSSSDPEQKSSTDEFAIQPNDLFILMTDGVLDNLFEKELVALVHKGYKSPQALAKTIADTAHRFSLDQHRRSPFAVSAESYGMGRHNVGGKEDDIAVVVGIVKEKEQGESGDEPAKSML